MWGKNYADFLLNCIATLTAVLMACVAAAAVRMVLRFWGVLP